MSHHYFFNPHTSLKTIVSWQLAGNTGKTDTFSVQAPDLFTQSGEKSEETKYTLSLAFRKKLNVKHVLDAGFIADVFAVDYNDSTFRNGYYVKFNRYAGESELWSSFMQWHYQPSEVLDLYSGLRFQYFALNRSHTLEPRGGIKYHLRHNQACEHGIWLSQPVATKGCLFLPDRTEHRMRLTHQPQSWLFTKCSCSARL